MEAVMRKAEEAIRYVDRRRHKEMKSYNRLITDEKVRSKTGTIEERGCKTLLVSLDLRIVLKRK